MFYYDDDEITAKMSRKTTVRNAGSLATTEKRPQSFSFLSFSYFKGKGVFCQDLFTFLTNLQGEIFCGLVQWNVYQGILGRESSSRTQSSTLTTE